MNKYDLAKLFGDVDDKFIEGAKPEAQQAVHLTIKKRSPIKIAIASTCAAAVLAGGVITVNALRSGGGLSPLDSTPGTVSIIDESSGISDNASDPNSSVSQDQTGNWFSDTQIYYDGEYYMVPEAIRTQNGDTKPRVTMSAGIRKSSEGAVEIVTVLKNNFHEPAGIRCYGADSVTEVEFIPIADVTNTDVNAWMMDEKPLSVTLEPGEMCFQKTSFNVGLGKYMGKVSFSCQNADPKLSNFSGMGYNWFWMEITEDGIKEYHEIREVPDVSEKPAADAIQQLENEGFSTTTTTRTDETVPKDCVIETYPPAHSMEDMGSVVVVIVSWGPRNVDSTASEPNKTDNKTVSEWAAKPLVLPSKSAPEDFDFVNTGDGFQSPSTTIEAPRGSEVYAVDDGEVLFADYDTHWNNGYGNYVVIKHAENMYTIYSHLLSAEESEKGIVSAGDKVKAGQCIGLAGNSGHMKVYGLGYSFCTELPQFFKNMNWEIPNFTDKPWSEVVQQLEKEGVPHTTTFRIDDTIPRDCVIATDPPAHSMVNKENSIKIIVSMGSQLDKGSGEDSVDLSADLDGDGVPDALEALNPDKTEEDWEQWKVLEGIEKQRAES